jgi:hypothetical protein
MVFGNGSIKTQASNTALGLGGSGLMGKALAFASNAPRFNEKQLNDESEAFLGPGYYEQKSCFNKLKGNKVRKRTVQTAVGGRSRIMASTVGSTYNPVSKQEMPPLGKAPADAIAPFDVGATKVVGNQPVQGPGPGHYSHKNLHSWNKRSYNVNFTRM